MFYPIAKDQDPNIGVKGKQKLFFRIFNLSGFGLLNVLFS